MSDNSHTQSQEERKQVKFTMRVLFSLGQKKILMHIIIIQSCLQRCTLKSLQPPTQLSKYSRQLFVLTPLILMNDTVTGHLPQFIYHIL